MTPDPIVESLDQFAAQAVVVAAGMESFFVQAKILAIEALFAEFPAATSIKFHCMGATSHGPNLSVAKVEPKEMLLPAYERFARLHAPVTVSGSFVNVFLDEVCRRPLSRKGLATQLGKAYSKTFSRIREVPSWEAIVAARQIKVLDQQVPGAPPTRRRRP